MVKKPHPLPPSPLRGEGTARRAPTHHCFSFAPLPRANLRFACAFALCFCLFGCELRFGALPTATPTATPTPTSRLLVVWTADGDLFAWRDDAPTPRRLAIGGAITPILAPDGRHVAFTRGSQSQPDSLWIVGIDGLGAQEIAVVSDIRAQIRQVAWLDEQTLYFNTQQPTPSGAAANDDLYRFELGGYRSLILPPGAGGHFAIAPDGQSIAVVSTGIYDMLKGRVALLDPLGARVREALTFTAVNTPDQPPFYPPLEWSDDGAFVRVPIPDHDGKRVTLWRAAPNGDAGIFGYVTAERDGLPRWSGDQMLYLQTIPAGADLFIADANGENAQIYASGTISEPCWLPDGEHFAYFADGYLWIARRGEAALRLLSASPGQETFAGDWVVYSSAAGGLRAQSIDGGGSVLITATPNPAFDALITDDGTAP